MNSPLMGFHPLMAMQNVIQYHDDIQNHTKSSESPNSRRYLFRMTADSLCHPRYQAPIKSFAWISRYFQFSRLAMALHHFHRNALFSLHQHQQHPKLQTSNAKYICTIPEHYAKNMRHLCVVNCFSLVSASNTNKFAVWLFGINDIL